MWGTTLLGCVTGFLPQKPETSWSFNSCWDWLGVENYSVGGFLLRMLNGTFPGFIFQQNFYKAGGFHFIIIGPGDTALGFCHKEELHITLTLPPGFQLFQLWLFSSGPLGGP